MESRVASEGPAGDRLRGMRYSIAIAVAALGLGCQISPVVSTPEEGSRSSRYRDCKDAARAYCRDFRGASQEEMKKCVAEAAFKCTSGGSE
jgi:hypothetical protein